MFVLFDLKESTNEKTAEIFCGFPSFFQLFIICYASQAEQVTKFTIISLETEELL